MDERALDQLIGAIAERAAEVGRRRRHWHDPYRENHAVAKPWLTWGNQQAIGHGAITLTAEQQIANLASTQILNVNYDMPTTWTSRVIFDFDMVSGETNPITVQYTITHGVGQALATVTRTFTVNEPYAQVVDDQVFPAQGIQCAAAIAAFTASTGGLMTVVVTALVAPQVA